MLEDNIILLKMLYQFLLFANEHITNGCEKNNIKTDIYKLHNRYLEPNSWMHYEILHPKIKAAHLEENNP
jgi:hypothetical protein